MGQLTTHVLNTALGIAASGLKIELWTSCDNPCLIKTMITNADGRVAGGILTGDDFNNGVYELHFFAGDYLHKIGLALPQPAFLDIIPIRFGIADNNSHYHVPLLLSPYGYSTYRGS